MKRFLLTLSALTLTASLASASCFHASLDEAPTLAAAKKAAQAWEGVAPLSCTLGVMGASRTTVWFCSMHTATACAADMAFHARPRRSYLESVMPQQQEQRFDGPNGRGYYCHPESGCVPMPR